MDICYHICVLFFCSNSTCPAWYNLFVCQQILPAIGISADLPEEKTRPFKSRIRPFCVGKRPFNADPFPNTFFQSRFSSGLPSSSHPEFLHIRSKVRQAHLQLLPQYPYQRQGSLPDSKRSHNMNAEPPFSPVIVIRSSAKKHGLPPFN